MISNITGANDARTQNYMGLTLDWKLTGAKTTGTLALVEAHGFPGTEPPLHYHESADEFFYIIEGDMTFRVGEEVKRIGGSGSVWIPRTTVHGFVIHSETSKFLFGFSPAGLEQMFMEISAPRWVDAARKPASPELSSNGDMADAHRARHRTIVVGPPLRKALAIQS